MQFVGYEAKVLFVHFSLGVPIRGILFSLYQGLLTILVSVMVLSLSYGLTEAA